MKFYQKTTTIEQAADFFKKSSSFAIFLHTRADGDAVGAGVALKLALQKLGKTAEVFCDTELTDGFLKFDECSDIKKSFFGSFDAFVSVDCATLNRLGEFFAVYQKHRNTLSVDHHKNDFFSALNCIKSCECTSRIVYEILNCLKVEIDNRIATFLFMGLSTDTGNFAHSCTTSDSFEFAAKLASFGADNELVSRAFFKDISLKKTKLIATALSKMRTYYDEKLVILFILTENLKSLGLSETASEGIVQFAVNIDSSEVGICLCQHSENSYAVSMRSKGKIDVSAICAGFGGGGHTHAAGCILNGFFEDVMEKIVKAVGEHLEC